MTSAYEQGNVPTIEVKHRLRIAREFAGLDQDELAARSGIARATISNAENGSNPRRTTINAWALACGVPASWINDGEVGSKRPPGGGDGGGLPTPWSEDEWGPKPPNQQVSYIYCERPAETDDLRPTG